MRTAIVLAVAGLASAAAIEKRQQYFQTVPELYAGPTPTGFAPMLAATNPAPFPSVSYIPPSPLETQVPISGAPCDGNIFQMFGQLSHYFPNPTGFGVNEFALPAGTNITQLQMLSRHGARYPTGTFSFADTLLAQQTSKTLNATGLLSFLNTWKNPLGQQILVPVGKQELFDSGTLHQYQYGHLYNNNGSKIIARSTTQDRMTQSAEYFLAGFFGLGWTQNATLELIIEQNLFNNSLAAYFQCNNSNTGVSAGGANASLIWENIYLANAVTRLQPLIKSVNVTTAIAYQMQQLCAYETVALGYSAFCQLFTYEEWQGYEYSVDLSFAGGYGFQSPTGRAVGIAYVQEVLARLNNHLLTSAAGSANITLDSMPSTFPLNQTLYFDFSHDTNIMAILTAFGLTQFNQLLSPTEITPNRQLIVSHMEPFGARLDIEVLQAPAPVDPTRVRSYLAGPPTTYIHFILNQRTIPLGYSYAGCGMRADGWCEMSAFMNATTNLAALANYDYACNGNYAAVPYGNITNGAPNVGNSLGL